MQKRKLFFAVDLGEGDHVSWYEVLRARNVAAENGRTIFIKLYLMESEAHGMGLEEGISDNTQAARSACLGDRERTGFERTGKIYWESSRAQVKKRQIGR